MTKLLGSVIVFIGSGLIWHCQWKERERRRTTLADLVSALRRMQEEIRMARTPLPELLVCVAKDCGRDCSDFLCSVADAVSQGKTLSDAWRTGCEKLPLRRREQDMLMMLSLYGDEEKVCKDISVVTYELAKRAAEVEQSRPEEEKRATALCFSGAALLVILLI